MKRLLYHPFQAIVALVEHATNHLIKVEANSKLPISFSDKVERFASGFKRTFQKPVDEDCFQLNDFRTA